MDVNACQPHSAIAEDIQEHVMDRQGNKNDRIDSEKLAHPCAPTSSRRPTFTRQPSAPCALVAVRQDLRQRISTSGRRSELLARIHSHQLAHNRTPAKQTRRTRDFWEEQLLKAPLVQRQWRQKCKRDGLAAFSGG